MRSLGGQLALKAEEMGMSSLAAVVCFDHRLRAFDSSFSGLFLKGDD